MSEPAQQPKPQKPTRIKILQWVYLVLFIVFLLYITRAIIFVIWACTQPWVGEPPSIRECLPLSFILILVDAFLPTLFIGINSFLLFKFPQKSMSATLIFNLLAFLLLLLGIFATPSLMKPKFDFDKIYWFGLPIFLLIASYFIFQAYRKLKD